MAEFDKEAERERLREKFANEEAERASARHMSELLLQGATMTDRHCPECGTPLFRQNEETFCPECERTVVEKADPGVETPPTEADDTSPVSTPTPSTGSTREHLEAALERAAASAATADDPRTAKEHLEAARAAIEAINALDADQSGA